MRLRIRGRYDSLLLVGFAAALLLIFERSVQYGLDVARDIERIYGVALLPALFILTIMFMFHEVAKRREATAEAAAAAVEATVARVRMVELENLMRFGHALAGSLSTEALKETIWQHLPALASQAPVWVVLRTDTGWERLTDIGGLRWDGGAVESTAEAVAQSGATRDSADGIEHDGQVCFPMRAGLQVIGIMGIGVAESSFEVRRKLSAAAAFLSVAINNARLFAEVRAHGVKDDVTGCHNRKHTLEILQAETARARRTKASLSVVMFDVDNFKAINDQHGHSGGDAVLSAIGARLRESLRKSDVRCRYGGDEFLIVLPDTSNEGAARVAEWIRGQLEQLNVCAAGQPVPVTVSVGVATTQNPLESVEGLIDRADRALYQAKAAGRNCVRVALSTRAGVNRGEPLHAVAMSSA
jgi:diguanylate cyclase (GGDEF)-like protein